MMTDWGFNPGQPRRTRLVRDSLEDEKEDRWLRRESRVEEVRRLSSVENGVT